MVKYKTTPDKIINIVKDNIANLKSFELVNFEDDFIDLKYSAFDFTINFKKDGDYTLVLVSWKFNQKSNGLESIGGKKGTNELLAFIDSHLDEDEKTEQSKNAIISIQKSKSKFKVAYGVIIIVSCLIGWWIGGGFNTSSEARDNSSNYKSKSACSDIIGSYSGNLRVGGVSGTATLQIYDI